MRDKEKMSSSLTILIKSGQAIFLHKWKKMNLFTSHKAPVCLLTRSKTKMFRWTVNPVTPKIWREWNIICLLAQPWQFLAIKKGLLQAIFVHGDWARGCVAERTNSPSGRNFSFGDNNTIRISKLRSSVHQEWPSTMPLENQKNPLDSKV